jgi:hypothetical protein
MTYFATELREHHETPSEGITFVGVNNKSPRFLSDVTTQIVFSTRIRSFGMTNP